MSDLPLSGITVLDFTAAWSGPFTTRSLAYLGARVIKVESPVGLDTWRGTVRGTRPDNLPDREQGERPYDRSAGFNTQNHDKLSMALNLKAPGAREVIKRLAALSDVVVANFSPGVLDRLGLGYDDLREHREDIIFVEMPAFGSGGPMSHHVGMGMTMEAATGMPSLMGYGDGEPVLTGPAYMDPVGGLHGAAAVMTALVSRDLTGGGRRIEVAQTEAALQWIGAELIEYLEHDHAWEPSTNRVPHAAPHDSYPCLGDDEWIAIAVQDDTQWRALCEVISRSDLLEDPRFATTAERARDEGDLRDAIAAWTSTHHKLRAAVLLQRAGVPAAPVHKGGDVALDPTLWAEQFFTHLDHPAVGRHAYPGLAYRLERTPGSVRVPAPTFAQHNDHVLVDLLGYGPAEVDQLRADGAVVDAPIGFVHPDEDTEA